MFRPDCKASRVIFRTGSKKQPPMKGSPAIGTRLLNGLELKHQSRFGLDCLNDHSIAEDLSRLLVERTSRGVGAFNCTHNRIEGRATNLWAVLGFSFFSSGYLTVLYNSDWRTFMPKTLEELESRRDDLRRQLLEIGDFRPGTVYAHLRQCG